MTRAVRTPSRVDTDLQLTALLNPAVPLFLRLSGQRSSQPRGGASATRPATTRSWERPSPGARPPSTADTTTCWGSRSAPRRLEAEPPPPHLLVPVLFGNELRGRSKGFEIAPTWDAASWLRFKAAYSYLAIEMVSKPGHNDPTTIAQIEGSSPKAPRRGPVPPDLPHGMEVDLTYRRVAALASQQAKAYDTADLRVHLGRGAISPSPWWRGTCSTRTSRSSAATAGRMEVRRAYTRAPHLPPLRFSPVLGSTAPVTGRPPRRALQALPSRASPRASRPPAARRCAVRVASWSPRAPRHRGGG